MTATTVRTPPQGLLRLAAGMLDVFAEDLGVAHVSVSNLGAYIDVQISQDTDENLIRKVDSLADSLGLPSPHLHEGDGSRPHYLAKGDRSGVEWSVVAVLSQPESTS